MSAKYGLLGLLSYGDQTGYDLNKTFEYSLNYFWNTQTSQIYKELNTMEKDEWLTSKLVYQDDKPNRKVYSITPLGLEELHKWLSKDFVDREMRIRNAFLIKVFFSGGNDVDDNIAMFERYREACQSRLDSMAQTNENVEAHIENEEERKLAVYWKMTARYGEYYFKMCVDWATEMIEILKKEKNK